MPLLLSGMASCVGEADLSLDQLFTMIDSTLLSGETIDSKSFFTYAFFLSRQFSSVSNFLFILKRSGRSAQLSGIHFQSSAFLVRPEKQITHTNDQQYRNDHACHICVSCKQAADLIDDQ